VAWRMRRWGRVTSSLCSRYLFREQARDASRDHQQKGDPRKEKEEQWDENVELLTSTEVGELVGEDHLDGMVVEDNRSGARRTLGARALFVFVGAEANTGWLEGTVGLDHSGFILTGGTLDRSALDGDVWAGLGREPYPLETNLPGVFAAGDVRSGSIKRVSSAVGEGSMAVKLVHQHLADVSVRDVRGRGKGSSFNNTK
jgi:thioredoxin reductase (NADPH)